MKRLRLQDVLKTKPYPFQFKGIRFLHKCEGRAILGDDMGVGKTIQVLGWLASTPAAQKFVVIVCPAVAKGPWSSQIAEHTHLCHQVLSSTKAQPITENVVVINYDILHHWLPVLLAKKPTTLIMDECHHIKNRKAKRTLACMALSRWADHVIATSGTPIINRPVEFWPALNMVDSVEFRAFTTYGMRYCDPQINEWSGHIEYKGSSNIQELHERLSPIFLRRTKAEVLPELPEKNRIRVPVTIDRKEYDQAETNFLTWYRGVAGKEKAKRAKKATALVRLGQLKKLAARHKVPIACEWIKEFMADSDEKLVVFCHHKEVAAALRKAFPQAAVGGGSSTHRIEQVDRFQNDPACRLFIGSTKADGVSITLTAAATVLFLELGWTAAEHEQAEDRINRIGQTADHITIYYMLAEATVEAYVLDLIDTKRQIVNVVLDGKQDQNEWLRIIKRMVFEKKHR